MNKVILYIATSLDGFIADDKGGVDWLPHHKQDMLGFNSFLERASVIMMGSRSYKQILGFGEWIWLDKQTYVFTSQNLTAEQPCIKFVNCKARDILDNLQDSNIWLLGGAELVKSFAVEKLIDEVILTVIPVNLGSGIALNIDFHDFNLLSETQCIDDIVQKVYIKV